MSGPLVVVGDTLLDRDLDGVAERLCPEAPVPVVEDVAARARPGGAGLAAALASADGRDVVLVTALADDEAAFELAALLREAGIRVVDLGLAGPTQQKIRVRAEARLIVRIDRGGRSRAPVGPLSDEAREALAEAAAVLVSDYGRGVAEADGMRQALAATAGRTALIWDPHPRGREPVAGARLATPNRAEAARLIHGVEGEGVEASARRARLLRARWRADAVAVTMGALGAVVAEGSGEPLHVAAPAVRDGDPCGAGDRFAVSAAELVLDGHLVADAVEGAVRAASAFVGAGGAGSLATGDASNTVLQAKDRAGSGATAEASNTVLQAADPAGDQGVDEVLARVRARGGTVVATGGCFDLLHAGHVATLEAARSLGDCLVVCLNSDQSVRRLKGPDRPLQSEEDRAAVLRALAAVDAVVVFDEDTPEAVLDRLRPDVWVKGGDYVADELPEARVLERWGGQAVIVPYVAGRSTTRLLEELSVRGG